MAKDSSPQYLETSSPYHDSQPSEESGVWSGNRANALAAYDDFRKSFRPEV